MTVQQLTEKLNLRIFSGEKGLQKNVSGGYVSDLLSDVMGNGNEGNIWITLQNHMNVIAIASLKEMACVILVKGIIPVSEIIEKAVEEGIPVLGSKENTFELSGEIYNLLNWDAEIQGWFTYSFGFISLR